MKSPGDNCLELNIHLFIRILCCIYVVRMCMCMCMCQREKDDLNSKEKARICMLGRMHVHFTVLKNCDTDTESETDRQIDRQIDK